MLGEIESHSLGLSLGPGGTSWQELCYWIQWLCCWPSLMSHTISCTGQSQPPM